MKKIYSIRLDQQVAEKAKEQARQKNRSFSNYEYGHEYSKKTLLWLKNLPLLKPTDIKENYKPYLPSNTGGAKRGQKHSRGTAKNAKESSKTFEGIARAMAEQWLLACC